MNFINIINNDFKKFFINHYNNNYHSYFDSYNTYYNNVVVKKGWNSNITNFKKDYEYNNTELNETKTSIIENCKHLPTKIMEKQQLKDIYKLLINPKIYKFSKNV